MGVIIEIGFRLRLGCGWLRPGLVVEAIDGPTVRAGDGGNQRDVVDVRMMRGC
jgi:hypothetical protein